jgi:hypothetical protein
MNAGATLSNERLIKVSDDGTVCIYLFGLLTNLGSLYILAVCRNGASIIMIMIIIIIIFSSEVTIIFFTCKTVSININFWFHNVLLDYEELYFLQYKSAQFV